MVAGIGDPAASAKSCSVHIRRPRRLVRGGPGVPHPERPRRAVTCHLEHDVTRSRGKHPPKWRKFATRGGTDPPQAAAIRVRVKLGPQRFQARRATPPPLTSKMPDSLSIGGNRSCPQAETLATWAIRDRLHDVHPRVGAPFDVDPMPGVALRPRRGRWRVRVGHELIDNYLHFLSGRSRPNSVLAAGYGLKVFFAWSAEEPAEVPVKGRHQLRGRAALAPHRRQGGAAERRRRRAVVAHGGPAPLQPVGRAAPLVRTPKLLPHPRAGGGEPAHRHPAHRPGPGHGRTNGARRTAPLRGAWARLRRNCRWDSAGCSSPKARAYGS